MDDNGDYRPGLLAIKELGVRSPLREAGLYKEEIREMVADWLREYGFTYVSLDLSGYRTGGMNETLS